MPIKITPCAFARCHCACKRGASCLQGSHHDAQKLTTTSFPFRSARWSVLPACLLNRARVKSGAGLPSSGSLLVPLFEAGAGVSSATQSKASNATFTRLTAVKIMILRLRDLLFCNAACCSSCVSMGELVSVPMSSKFLQRDDTRMIMLFRPDSELAAREGYLTGT